MKFTAESTVFNDTKVQEKFSELTVDADGIRTEVGKKVGNSEIISKINQSAETVKIQASKVEVDGTLIIGKSQADAAYDSKGSAATAAQTASKYITADSTSGIKVHAEANPTTNYAQIDDTGMSIYQGVDGVATEVAEFKASGVRIGQEDKANVNVTPNSVEINAYTGSNAVTITCESATDYTGEIDYGIKITDEHNQSAIRILPTVIENEAFDGTLELTSLMARYDFDCNGGMYMYCGEGGFSVGGPTKEFFCVDEGGQITVDYQQPPILYEDVAEIVTYSAGTVGTRAVAISLGTTTRTGYTYIGATILRHQNTDKFWINLTRNSENGNAYAVIYRASTSAVNGMAITIRKMWASTKITGIPE